MLLFSIIKLCEHVVRASAIYADGPLSCATEYSRNYVIMKILSSISENMNNSLTYLPKSDARILCIETRKFEDTF